MGLFGFMSPESKQSAVNQQVGVQGGVGISASNFTALNGGITLESLDPATVKAALDFGAGIGNQAINSSRETTIAALSALTANQTSSNKLINDAVASAEKVALTATPRDTGSIVETYVGAQQKTMLIVGGVVAVIVGLYIMKGSK